MRAAPYDLGEWGFEPVRIETADGRRQYSTLQREIAENAAPIRAQVIRVLNALLDGVAGT